MIFCFFFVEENQRRQNFAQEHGRYLPTSMCPVITEPAVQYSLTADIKPSALPKLSKKYTREQTSASDKDNL